MLLTDCSLLDIILCENSENYFSIADVNRQGCFPQAREQSVFFLMNRRRLELKDRKKQRENRRLKHKEERIDKYNIFGLKDLTTYNALLQIETNGKANIILK